MSQRQIYADDLTNREIDGTRYAVKINLQITSADSGDIDWTAVETYAGEWDADGNTAAALESLVGDTDLVSFILRMRGLVSLAADPEVVRKWVKDAHPEIKVNDRGRVPADVMALYRREVVTKTNAGDAPK